MGDVPCRNVDDIDRIFSASKCDQQTVGREGAGNALHPRSGQPKTTTIRDDDQRTAPSGAMTVRSASNISEGSITRALFRCALSISAMGTTRRKKRKEMKAVVASREIDMVDVRFLDFPPEMGAGHLWMWPSLVRRALDGRLWRISCN